MESDAPQMGLRGTHNRTDREQVGQHDASRDVLDEGGVRVAVARGTDEQDLGRACEGLGERLLLDVEIVARDRLALVGRLGDVAELKRVGRSFIDRWQNCP